MNRKRGQSPGGRAEYVNELSYEVRLLVVCCISAYLTYTCHNGIQTCPFLQSQQRSFIFFSYFTVASFTCSFLLHFVSSSSSCVFFLSRRLTSQGVPNCPVLCSSFQFTVISQLCPILEIISLSSSWSSSCFDTTDFTFHN